MANSDVTTGEIMEFLQEHMVTKEEFNGLKSDVSTLKSDVSTLKTDVAILGVEMSLRPTRDEVEEKLTEFKNEILSATDSIVVQHKTFDIELAAARGALDRHEERLIVVEQKLGVAA